MSILRRAESTRATAKGDGHAFPVFRKGVDSDSSCAHAFARMALVLSWPCTQRCGTDMAPLADPIRTRAAIHLMDIGNNVLPAVTPVQDAADGARILDSHRARHGAEGAKTDRNVNHPNEPRPGRSASPR